MPSTPGPTPAPAPAPTPTPAPTPVPADHAAAQLPQVSYAVVDPDANVPPAVHDRLAESYGFNSGLEATRPVDDQASRYLRWLQPMESDLARQVEYDMDEQDQVWLDTVNRDRKREGQAPVTYEVFEILFDKLEKEWFDLTKSVPKKASALPTEDSKCAICDDGECENSNAIVFCDGCNLAVHQDCYGVPYIPEGQWLCRKCTVSPDKPVNCVLCPNSYGAFKQTTTQQWAHLLCAIWVPDTGVSNTVYMEPIDGIENIPKNRWKLLCYICKKKVGACIQCAHKNCFTAFHVTCARERKLDLKMKQGTERGELKAYCEKHSEGFVPPDAEASSPFQATEVVKRSHKRGGGITTTTLLLNLKRSKSGALTLKHATASSKSARAYKKTYSSGPPLVPQYVFDRVLAYVARVKMAKKPAFVALVCRYWSLKREARRGAPLLKRLHLEPWTASATSQQQTEVEKAQKLELTRLLRADLEKVRMLTERVRKREKKKLERAVLFKGLLDDFVFPKEKLMRDVLERIALLDKQHIFAQPVSRLQVPDYYDIIKVPMDWQTMREKLDRHEYLTTQDFVDDVELVINNARRYNKKDTPVHRSAVRVSDRAEPILAELEFVDAPQSDASLLAAASLQLLTPGLIDQLFEYHYDPVVPTPPPQPKPTPGVAKLLLNKGKGKGRGKGKEKGDVVDGEPGSARASRKRSADSAGLTPPPPTPTRASRSRSEASVALPPSRAGRPRAAVASTASAAPRGRRTSVAPGGPPAIVADVDNRSSFKLFETGWVLPEGSSRRKPGVLPPPQPPVASTSKAISVPVVRTAAPPSSRSQKGKQKAVTVDGQEHAASATEATPMEVDAPEASEDSKLTGGKKSVAQEVAEWRAQWKAAAERVEVTSHDQVGDGVLVWAKYQSYPPWPAEIADPENPDTPSALVLARPENAAEEHVLVMFFDSTGSGAWVTLKDLHLLGEDKEFDELSLTPAAMLSRKNRVKQKKSIPAQISELREAYNRACVNIEIEDPVPASTNGSPSTTKKRRR